MLILFLLELSTLIFWQTCTTFTVYLDIPKLSAIWYKQKNWLPQCDNPWVYQLTSLVYLLKRTSASHRGVLASHKIHLWVSLSWTVTALHRILGKKCWRKRELKCVQTGWLLPLAVSTMWYPKVLHLPHIVLLCEAASVHTSLSHYRTAANEMCVAITDIKGGLATGPVPCYHWEPCLHDPLPGVS